MSKKLWSQKLNIYKKGKILLRQPKITVAIMGSVPIRQDFLFNKRTGKQGFPNQRTEWDTYLNWHAEASRMLQDSQVA